MKGPTKDSEAAFAGLQTFPEEVILALFSYLTPKDLGTVASTCQLFKDISEDDELWFQLYRETKKKHLLESLPFTATAHLPASKAEEKRREKLCWKDRYKETFHIRAGTFFNKVELNLDKTVCEDGGDLSGEMVVTVASEKLRCHGIFVRISCTEKSFVVVGRNVSKRTQDLGEWNYPVYGSSSWETRQNATFTLRRGIYHVPFSFPISTKGKRGEALPSSRSSKGRGYHTQVEYVGSAILVVDNALSSVHSSPITLQMVPRSPKSSDRQQKDKEEKGEDKESDNNNGPLRKSVQKDFLLGGSATFGVTLSKPTFNRGEDIELLVDIDNKSSYSIKSADVSLNAWSRYRSGKSESHVTCNRSYPLDLKKGTQQMSLPFTLEWEDTAGDSLSSREAPVKQGYYIQVNFGIPYAVDPELLIPITLLQPHPH